MERLRRLRRAQAVDENSYRGDLPKASAAGPRGPLKDLSNQRKRAFGTDAGDNENFTSGTDENRESNLSTTLNEERFPLAAGPRPFAQPQKRRALEEVSKGVRQSQNAEVSLSGGQFQLIPHHEVQHDDLDAQDAGDPLMVPEYSAEIYDLLYQRQMLYMVHPKYMEKQPELNWGTRGILMNWIVSVHSKFCLLPETLYLAANLLDRYLELEAVPLSELQLMGTTALFSASKYEEVFCPSIQNFSWVGKFEDRDIVVAERKMLHALNFDVGMPNPLHFLRRLSKAENFEIRTRTLAKYMLEIMLFEPRLMVFRPSDVVAASMCLARRITNAGPWDKNLIHYSGGCFEKDILPIAAIMVDYMHAETVHANFYKKYSSKKFLHASIICRKWTQDRFDEFRGYLSC